MGYWKRHGSKIIKRCKKYNYRIVESYNYNDIEGYVYSYILQDYNGENTLEIEMTVSLRNMLGPHHLEEGESYLVHTLSWSKEPNAVGMKNPPYNEHYCFVETGLRNLILSD